MKLKRTKPRRPPRIVSVDVPGDFIIRVTFDDGLVREVDLEDRLWGPMFESLRNPARFRQVFVDPELGTVVWPNGADLDPDVLHGDFEPAAPSRESN
jgi:Protein of unknown function (DUF2442)